MNCQFCLENPIHPSFIFFCSKTCFLLGTTNYQQQFVQQSYHVVCDGTSLGVIQPIIQQKFCQVCHLHSTQPNSDWCSKKCRDARLPGSANYIPQPDTQQKNCQVCYLCSTLPNSNWCGKKCRYSRLPGSANYIPQPDIQQKFCQVCYLCSTLPNSNWCSKKCRYSRLPGSANYQAPMIVQHNMALPCIPFCQLCENTAQCNFKCGIPAFDLFDPGCCRKHTYMARQLGFKTAR
jgi:hypothetical protein